ncbi:MAG TPA: malate dehydrogenase, partial [Legionellaceae bacterium]|nr:malate dehydrogenase [Legionellaceae bacterium]
ANAIVGSVYHLLNDTSQGDSFSICHSSNGEYGVDPGLMFSFPTRRLQGQLQIVEGFTFNAYAQEKFNATLAELRSERDMVKSLGLLD